MSKKFGGTAEGSFWFGEEDAGGEPVLFLFRTDGATAVMTLDKFRDTAQQIFVGELTYEDAWQELYVKLPGMNGLLTCTVTFSEEGGKQKLHIQGTAAVSGILHTCDL